MANKKYAVYPEEVLSFSDGQRHFITAERLMRLYDVNPAECVIIDARRPNPGFHEGNLIPLRVRHNNEPILSPL